jgi:hypothetical protein
MNTFVLPASSNVSNGYNPTILCGKWFSLCFFLSRSVSS